MSLPQPTAITLLRATVDPARFCISPWCNRLDALLTLAQVPFAYGEDKASNLQSNTGRVPYVYVRAASADEDNDTTGEMLCDSEGAYDELVMRGAATELDAGLSARDLATGRMVGALVKQLMWAMEKERWMDNYAYARDHTLGHYAWPVRSILGHVAWSRKSSKLNAIEIGTLSPEALYQLLASGYDALVDLVADAGGAAKPKAYALGGGAPTRVDALVLAAVVAPLQAPAWNPVVCSVVRDRPILVRYAENMRETYWPARPTLLE